MGSTNLVQFLQDCDKEERGWIVFRGLHLLAINDEARGPLGAKGVKSLGSGPKCPGTSQNVWSV